MIRLAKNSDIEKINQLLYQVHAVHAQGRPDIFKLGAKKYTSEELAEIIADPCRPIYVYEDEAGEIGGYVFCELQHTAENASLMERRSIYIDDLCVDAEKRGGHIGTKLFDYVRDMAKEQGFDSVTLNVWSMNEGARRFYEKCGMHTLKTVMEYTVK